MPANGSARLALVVEDDCFLRNGIVEEFLAQGWLVVEAGSGEAALELLSDQPIDALFTDIQLDGVMQGWDVADAFRAISPSSPVVYTSGNAPNRSRRVEASLFFEKPYEPSEVVAACSRLLAAQGQPSAGNDGRQICAARS